jgi:hypothetical protein
VRDPSPSFRSWAWRAVRPQVARRRPNSESAPRCGWPRLGDSGSLSQGLRPASSSKARATALPENLPPVPPTPSRWRTNRDGVRHTFLPRLFRGNRQRNAVANQVLAGGL